jgi:hypothetical protein
VRLSAARGPLLSVAAVTSALTTTSAVAAEWTVTPSGQIFAQTQQNPRLIVDEDHTANAMGAQATARMQRRTERLAVSLQPSFTLYRYQDDSDLDRNEQHLDATMSWQGERHSWLGTATAARDTTLTSELGNTGLTQSNWRHETYEASLGPVWQAGERVRIGSQLGVLTHRYPGLAHASLLNYRYTTALVYLDYSLSDRLSVSFAGSGGRLNSERSDSHSDSTNVTLQAKYAWSPLWTVTVSAGPSWYQADETTERGLVFSADAKRSFETSSLSFEVSRSQSPSGRGMLTELEEASLRYSMQLTEHLSASANLRGIRRKSVFRSLGVDLENVRYGRIDAGLGWRVARNWQLALSVGDAVQRVSTFLDEGDTARGLDARLTVSWSGNPYVN